MIEEKNNHTRNQKRMYRIHKQEERIQDLELLVGTLQQENTQLKESKQKLDKIKEYININSELIYVPEEDSDISYVPSEPIDSIIGGE